MDKARMQFVVKRHLVGVNKPVPNRCCLERFKGEDLLLEILVMAVMLWFLVMAYKA